MVLSLAGKVLVPPRTITSAPTRGHGDKKFCKKFGVDVSVDIIRSPHHGTGVQVGTRGKQTSSMIGIGVFMR